MDKDSTKYIPECTVVDNPKIQNVWTGCPVRYPDVDNVASLSAVSQVEKSFGCVFPLGSGCILHPVASQDSLSARLKAS